MTRFPRWLFNGLAILLLLTALTTTAAWCASFWVQYHEVVAMPLWMGNPHQIYFVADRSSVSFCFRGYIQTVSQQEALGLVRNPSAWFHDVHLLGFRMFYGDEFIYANQTGFRDGDYRYGAGMPVIMAVSLLLVFSMILFGKARRSTDLPDGLCPTCGYDQRATPDRCPECGNVPIKMASDSLSAHKAV
jgi:hypothetical protein